MAYERYEPGSLHESTAALFLGGHYANTGSPVLALTPAQTRIIDAMAEAAGVPRQRGQPVMIPEYLKDHPKWMLSPEYQARVAQAKAKRGK